MHTVILSFLERFKRVFVTTLFLLLAATCTPPVFSVAIPTLPDSLKSMAPQVTLLDFYATWCGACKWMHPYVQHMEQKLGSKLKVIRIDVDQPANQAISNRYHIEGTPTYFLYGNNGEPVFVMNQSLDPLVLQSEVYRATRLTPATPPPASIFPKGLSSSGLTWVWFEQEHCCSHLIKLGEQLKKFPRLTVQPIALKEKSASAWMKQLNLSQAGSSALLDPQGRVLFRADATINADTIQKYLVMFTQGEYSKPH